MTVNVTVTLNHQSKQSGVALLIVVSSIALLTLIMYAFRYEVAVNKVRSYNFQDRLQAKLNAQAALHLGLARLEIYQELYNQLQQNKQWKNQVPSEMINQIWSFPLALPFPQLEGISLGQRLAFETFEKKSLLDGGLALSIQNLSGKFNINLLSSQKLLELQYLKTTLSANADQPQDPSGQPWGGGTDPNNPVGNPDGSAQNPAERPKTPFQELSNQFAETLEQMLREALNQKRDTDEEFYKKYANTDLNYLVSVLRFYISEDGTDIGPAQNQVEAEFGKNNLAPKYAPLTSLSEILLLPQWNQDLLSLIEQDITVFSAKLIDVNSLTPGMLKLMIPELTPEQIKAFYQLKKNAPIPIHFSSKKDFIQFMTDQIKVSSSSLQKSIEDLELSGLSFTSYPQLFRIMAKGSKGQNEYTIQATILLPLLTQKKIKKRTTDKNANDSSGTGPDPSNDQPDGTSDGSTTNPPEDKNLLGLPLIQEIHQG